jgi:hypothetical protein
MKAHRGSGVITSPFLTLSLDGSEWPHEEKSPSIHRRGEGVGPRADLDDARNRIPGREVCRSADTPTELRKKEKLKVIKAEKNVQLHFGQALSDISIFDPVGHISSIGHP